MKLPRNGLSAIRRFKKVWEGLVEPARIESARERHLSRVLNVILLLLIAWGILFEIQSRSNNRPFAALDRLVLLMMVSLALVYFLNRQGRFSLATLLTLGIFIASTFALVLIQHSRGRHDLSVLYFLIIAIVMSDLFFSLRGFLITITIIFVGAFGLSRLIPGTITVSLFLLVFCALMGFSSYNRRFLEREQLMLSERSIRERALLALEQRRSTQLSLLEEVGRQIADSLDEKEILQRALEAMVNQFGYAQAGISLLAGGDMLEIAAVSGTEDFRLQPGYRLRLGEGIAGHVGLTHKVHTASDVSTDPYYFSAPGRSGSAVGIPMLDKDHLLGVIYVESNTRNAIQADDVQTLQTLANQVATALQKARLYARTQRHLQLMTILQSISHAVASSLELDEILNNVIRLLKDSLGYTYLGVYLLEGETLHLGAQLGYPEDMLIHQLPISSGVLGRTARSKAIQFVRDVSTDPDFLRASYEVRSEIAIPLLKDENVLGVLNVESKDEAALDENDVNFLNGLAGSIAVAIDNARLHAEVKRMALTDVVSGLANRRAFDELLEAEISRASRYSQPISLIILDLDSFKEYNDKWGHPAGDVRLREIADLLQASVREPDVATRYGGEEFAIILPNTSKMGAVILAERLRHSAEACAPYRNGSNSPISGYTISLGVATFPDDASSVEELLHAADKAELTAKRLGKNRVHAMNFSNNIHNF